MLTDQEAAERLLIRPFSRAMVNWFASKLQEEFAKRLLWLDKVENADE